VTSGPQFAARATLEVHGVSKWFGQKVAVSEVDCSFGPGITGLLGPNGAGKTTLLRMLSGLLVPSEGTVKVFGEDPRSHPSIYARLGLVPEEDAVYGFLTGRAFVEYSARLSGVADPAAAAVEMLDAVQMTGDADRPVSTYSKGMRQRTKVAAALVHGPEVLILDEPLNGTDPLQRARLIEMFRRLAAAGHTVVVSSHVLAEVERMADRVLAMVDGKLAAAGDVTAIRAAMSDIPFRVRIESDGSRRLGAALVAAEGVQGIELGDGTIHVETTDLAVLGRSIPAMARDLDVRLTRFEPEDESLESVFRYLVRRR